ncbi:MAG: TonB family protein [Veillonella sp.]|uniref:energy transducer TonB n=1 Tax=Veillonella sp. TaxID=1926307 RepID=UPI0025F5637A|nr:energy transducer TonB [Veillonella sp.]MBS4913626.1 TonB family protein [Veillonella sp.]
MDRWYRSCIDSVGIHAVTLFLIGAAIVYWPATPPAPTYVEIEISGGGSLGGSGGGGDAGGLGNVGNISMPVKSAGTEAMVQAAMKEIDQAIESGEIVTSRTMNDAHGVASNSLTHSATMINSNGTTASTATTSMTGDVTGNGSGVGRNPDGHGAFRNGTGTGTGSGNGNGDADGDGRGTGEGSGNGLGAGFSLGGDGIYTATDGSNVDYTLLRDAEGRWPDEARTVGYSKVVRVNVRILVDTDGSISDVTVMNDAPNLGFKEEAVRAAYGMKFAPIYYEGRNIRMYMVKPIEFYPQ